VLDSKQRLETTMTSKETAMSTATYTVHGMTCGHCVSSVKEEVSEVAGVTNVEVDLATGLLTVGSEGPVDRARIAAAVEEAGYELADRS
jgi:copper chaperone CopZ